MIKFFRKIRQNLLMENKTSKYFKYAIGEIALVMIGILLALQVNNWNESRKKEEQFKSSLEQLYNKITDDAWYYDFLIRENENIINAIDGLLTVSEDSAVNHELPLSLWYSTMRSKNNIFPWSKPFLEKLVFNPEDHEQKKIANYLFNYNELITVKTKLINDVPSQVSDELIKNSIAFPRFDHTKINEGLVTDSIWYSDVDIVNAKNLLLSNHFRNLLKTNKSLRNFDILDFTALAEESENVLVRIKKYHPDVRLLFEDVGIIGTSINGFDDVGAKSTPMILVDEELSVWEITLHLKKGEIKFRCRDSWAINWGGNSFPKGKAEREGNDIYVAEAGNYRVILNLNTNSYEFIKLD